MIKNIASDPETFANKPLYFEAPYDPGKIDVGVFKGYTSAYSIELLIEYKSGPGATICDYINDDGKERGNLVRELVSRDLYNLGVYKRNLTSLQWRLEQPPANFKELVRECLMSEIGRAELGKLTLNTLRTLIPSANSFQEFIDELMSDVYFTKTFKFYP